MSEQGLAQDHSADVSRPPAGVRANQDGAAQPVRILVLAAVCLGVAALAAAAFVLSYRGIHAVAIQAGISAQYARYYPVLIDAMLVITLLAVLGLRGAGLPSRILSWLALLCVLAAAAGADVLHATGRMLRHTVGAATAAALPWALVFIAFVLLLALLRHARLRHQASVARRQTSPLATDTHAVYADRPAAAPTAPSLPVRTPRAWDSASIVPGFSARLVSSAAAGAAAAAAEEPGSVPDSDDRDPGEPDSDQDATTLGLATADDTDTGQGLEPAVAAAADIDATPADAPAELADAPAELAETPAEVADAQAELAEATPVDADGTPTDQAAPPADGGAESDEPPAAEPDAGAMPAGTGSLETDPPEAENDDSEASDPTAANQGADDDVADNMPVFHRMWSTPTPPES